MFSPPVSGGPEFASAAAEKVADIPMIAFAKISRFRPSLMFFASIRHSRGSGFHETKKKGYMVSTLKKHTLRNYNENYISILSCIRQNEFKADII